MAQRERFDEPGAWHHVMNRGVARRTIAETRRDARYFLSRLARAVRSGWFEVHAYSLLNTHFHLLLRSPRGEMWRGMLRFQNGYVRWFNRIRRRDGPLLRGRFRSKRIQSNTYWRTVVRYIDQNAAAARIKNSGNTYPYCSAYHYLRASGPPWLTRDELEAVVRTCSNRDVYKPSDYRELFGTSLDLVENRLIEARMTSNVEGQDPLDELMNAVPSRVRSWMVKKAHLADGTESGFPLVTSTTVISRLQDCTAACPVWNLTVEGKSLDAWKPMLAGLLRSTGGLTYSQIACYCGCSPATVRTRVQLHTLLLRSSGEYADVAAKVLSRSIRKDWRIQSSSSTSGPVQKHQEAVVKADK